MENMIKAGIIGATGYAGGELVRLLQGHKNVEIKWYGSRSYIDKKYYEVYQNMFEIVDDTCLDDNMEALAEQEECDVLRCSDFIETAPYGGVEQEPFLNGCLELRTLHTPRELLHLLHKIEREAHRERTIHWGPRTLDLDIIFYDDIVVDTETLTIPHIDMKNRDFVLQPLSQIAPYMRHPVYHKTVAQMWEELLSKES